MDYDEFEYVMQQAGWTMDEIETAWQRGERARNEAYFSFYDENGNPHEEAA